MAGQVLRIIQGDADTLTETITGLTSLSGYTAKMYIYDSDDTLKLTITGTISDLTVVYELVNENTKGLIAGTYWYETKVFDANDHVYTPNWGKIVISEALNKDPL